MINIPVNRVLITEKPKRLFKYAHHIGMNKSMAFQKASGYNTMTNS